MSKLYTAKDFLKKENIISFSPDDVLSKALASLRSSHDAGFVLDEKGVLLGAINPYYAVFQSKYPPQTKLRRAMIMPPKLTDSDKLSVILRNMLESKIYFLPVVNRKDQLLGIISFRRILKTLFADPQMISYVEKNILPDKPVTIPKQTTVAQAREIMKKAKTSRLCVVDGKGVLTGLLTRYDLMGILTEPTQSSRSSRVGQKKHLLTQRASDYMQNLVVTQASGTPILSLFALMRQKRIGSIVLVNDAHQPTGVISYRTILKSVLKKLNRFTFRLNLTTPKDFSYRDELYRILQQHFARLGQKAPVKHVESILSIGRRPDQSLRWYELRVKLGSSSRSTTIRERADGWRRAVAQALSKLKTNL